MKILVAPDSFKGSLSARQAADAMARGIRRRFPDAEIVMVPLADGGEGFADTLIEVTKGDIMGITVTGPLGEPIPTRFGVLDGGTRAVLDMASASGLTLVPADRRNPMLTTSYGTGEMILAASQLGVDEIIVGIGGSATNDGGLGAMQALGVRFVDLNGHPIPDRSGGGALARIDRIDISGLCLVPGKPRIRVACDVTNPLCGSFGASVVYGPQKGADPDMVRDLDRSLERFGRIVARDVGCDLADIPGAGAAGGMGAALLAFLDAHLERGIDLVLNVCQFAEKLRNSDLVLTGEGSIDHQTLAGKAVDGVLRMAKAAHVDVIAFGGRVEAEAAEELKRSGLIDAVPITPLGMPLDEAITRAEELLEEAVFQTVGRRYPR